MCRQASSSGKQKSLTDELRLLQRQRETLFRGIWSLSIIGTSRREYAIEILIRCSSAPTHVGRSILIDAVIGIREFMSIGVVNGYEQHNYLVEQTRTRFGDGDVTQQRKSGVLSVRFAGMDTRLYATGRES